jgi:4-carboxymuconolactone decarboxylase
MPRAPRIMPLTDAEMSEEQHELTKHYRRGGVLPNIFRVALRNMKLFKAYKPFGLYTMALSSVPPRIREIAILRVAYNSKSDYEWGHHVRLARDEGGLSVEEIARIKQGPDVTGWGKVEAAVIRMVDQMRATSDLDDETYAVLMEALGEDAFVELLNTIGNYAMVSSLLNILGVPLEEGVPGIDTPLSN